MSPLVNNFLDERWELSEPDDEQRLWRRLEREWRPLIRGEFGEFEELRESERDDLDEEDRLSERRDDL